LARSESSSHSSSSALSPAHSPQMSTEQCELPSEPDSQVTVDNYPDRKAEYDEYLQNSATKPNDFCGDFLLAQGGRCTGKTQHLTQDAASYCLKRSRDKLEEEEQ